MESNVATAGFQVQSVEKTIQKLPHGQNRGQRVKVIYIYEGLIKNEKVISQIYPWQWKTYL